MTALIALIRKDLILYLNDKRAWMLHLLMPVILAAVFGSMFGGGPEAKTSRIDVGLVLLDQSEGGRKIADGLKADSTLRVTELGQAEAQAQVREGKLPVAVVIPPVFGEAVVSPVVLPVAAGSLASTCTPSCGLRAASPYWPATFGLSGMASARAWLAATLRSRVSAASLLLPRLCGGVVSDGPPELLKTEPAPSVDGAFCLVAIYLL